jgi:hypothetical protein
MPAKYAGLEVLVLKFFFHILPDLIAGLVYTGPQGNEKRCQVAVKTLYDRSESFADNSLKGTSPSTMDSGHNSLLGVHDKCRKAIRGLNDEEDTATIGYECIPFHPLEGGLVDDMDDIRVRLPEGYMMKSSQIRNGIKIFILQGPCPETMDKEWESP